MCTGKKKRHISTCFLVKCIKNFIFILLILFFKLQQILFNTPKCFLVNFSKLGFHKLILESLKYHQIVCLIKSYFKTVKLIKNINNETEYLSIYIIPDTS